MELLDRYLQAVKFWLPKAQQDDMIAELRDDLNSQIEERESSLGRALTEDEIVALLRQTGHPVKVAARYQPRQQSLIGPMLFPIYKFVLKMVSLCYLLPSFLLWTALVLFFPRHHAHAENAAFEALRGYAGMWTNAILVFGIVTLVFAMVERFQHKIDALNEWDPRKLPRVNKRKEHISRVQSIFELVFSILFIWGWLALPAILHGIFASEEKILTLTPALTPYYWWALLPMVINMAHQAINLYRPDWTWLRPPVQLLSNAITAAIILFMVRLYPYFTVATSAVDSADAKDAMRYAQLAVAANQFSRWGLMCLGIGVGIALIVTAFQTVQIIRKYKSGPPTQAAVQISQVM